VKQSSFEKTIKIHWAGDYATFGASGNSNRFIFDLITKKFWGRE